MIFTQAILDLQTALRAAGYHVEETPAESSGWLAYLPDRDTTLKCCHSSGKPPALCITADDIQLPTTSYKAATFSIRGQAGESEDTWMQIQVYSVAFKAPDDVMRAIPLSAELCRSAWNAVVTAVTPVLPVQDTSICYDDYPDVVYDECFNSYRKPRQCTLGFDLALPSSCTECHKPLLWNRPTNRRPPHLPFCSKVCASNFNGHDFGRR